MQGSWTSRAFRKPAITFAPIDEAYMDKEVVVLLNSMNTFGDKVYSYVQLTIRNFQTICEKVASRQKFLPSEFGTVLAAGKGFPPEELQEEMRQTYNIQPVPSAGSAPVLPTAYPKVWGAEDDDNDDGETGIDGNEPSPSIE